MKVSVVMPVYNERATIEEIVQRVLAQDIDELIIVDDASTDGTGGIVRRLADSDTRITAVFHSENTGKGGAVKTGLLRATGDIVIIQDADLEYDPADYEKLLEPLEADRADLVFGSRFLGQAQRLTIPQRIANRAVTALFNLLFGTRLSDVETCYKAFRRRLLNAQRLRSTGFDADVEIAARLVRAGARVAEVPVRYRGRSYAEGKKIRWYDLLGALWAVVKWRLARL